MEMLNYIKHYYEKIKGKLISIPNQYQGVILLLILLTLFFKG
jgi:hypothetical protein